MRTRVQTQELLRDLISRTQKNISEGKRLLECEEHQLNWRPKKEAWSILECLEHLNLYGDFYLPVIADRINTSRKSSELYFTSGLVGNYFAKSMSPKKRLNKMRTFKSKNPKDSHLSKYCIHRFVQQQESLLMLLEQAQTVSLSKTKVPVSISNWIRLKLGDTFRFVIYHNQRHLTQVQNILQSQNN